MTRHIFFIFGMVLALQAAPVFLQAAQAQTKTLGIAAVVNDQAISMTDVDDRIKLVLASSGLPGNKEVVGRIMPQVIEGLIEEQLKLQEARRHNLEVTEAEIEEGFGTIAAQNNFTIEQFKSIMSRQGIPISTLERQIRAQLAWTKVVKAVYRQQVDVTARDVDNRIQRIKANMGKTEYLVAEIYLPIEGDKRAAEVQQFASRMAADLQAKKAPFGPVAVQFSKAAGAANGGLIGWVQQGHLAPELDKAMVSLQEGQISNPIRSGNGLYILQLQAKRTLTEDAVPPRDELTNQIGFERLDRVQQKALLDLKTSAFIDRRV